jgi:hypothetical protein
MTSKSKNNDTLNMIQIDKIIFGSTENRVLASRLSASQSNNFFINQHDTPKLSSPVMKIYTAYLRPHKHRKKKPIQSASGKEMTIGL